MKKAWMVMGALGYLALTSQPAQAKCVPLIKEAREQLANAALSKSDETRVKALLVEADKLSEANNHKEGVQKANEALNIIRKK